MWLAKVLVTLCLIYSSLAFRETANTHGKSDERTHDKSSEDSEEVMFFNRKDVDGQPATTTTRSMKGEIVVEKFVETLMASERYLKMIESVERKLNHLDATFHERTNSILKYVSEMLRAIKNTPTDTVESALRSIKADMDRIKLTMSERLEHPIMRGKYTRLYV